MLGMKRVWIDRNYGKCSGCRRCEIACSVHHEGRIWPEASRIRVFMLIPGVEIPHLCFQCEDYPCIEACPTGALSVDVRTGAVKVEAPKCTACGLCVKACPGSVPHMHPESNRIVICDLCGGKPRCVEACMEGGWGALLTFPREKVRSRRALAKPPRALTLKVAKNLLGAQVAKEALS
ncbi:MAG: 4Fe-4S dicluster domain-containing protein [Candidatus Brockarchaeota archaeon]|nr:4Fe-4S dicluster domain-containing protein [Candidatus Brockarchaeota archaeon]